MGKTAEQILTDIDEAMLEMGNDEASEFLNKIKDGIEEELDSMLDDDDDDEDAEGENEEDNGGDEPSPQQ